MANTILGLFKNVDHANMALGELDKKGYTSGDITVVVRDNVVMQDVEIDENNTAEGAKDGAAAGGLIGGLLGLLVGIGAVTIPGVGAVLFAGPLLTALGITGVAGSTAAGALTGALAGGFVGALVNLGISENVATVYEERIREGDILIGVNARENDEEEVEELLKKHNASDISYAEIG